MSKAPDDVDVNLMTALGHARAGQFPNAIDSMRRVLRDGVARHRALSVVRVLDETGQLYAMPPADRPVCLLAHLHRYLRIFDPSQTRLVIARAKDAVAGNDHGDDAYVSLGVIHHKQAEDAEALAAFLQAIEINARNVEAHRWASVIYESRGDLESQRRMLRVAHEIAPDDPVYTVLYARLLANRLGDYQTALAIERQQQTTGPETAAGLNHRARLHALLNEPAEALALYRRAAGMAPTEPDHLQGEAWALMLLDRNDEALAVLGRALTLDPGLNETRYRIGLLHQRMGRYEDALRDLEPALLRDSRWSDHRPDLCTMYFLTARFDRARWCADRFLAWSPEGRFLSGFDLLRTIDRHSSK